MTLNNSSTTICLPQLVHIYFLVSAAAKISSGVKIEEYQTRALFQFSSRILQLDSFSFDDIIYCAARTINNTCHLLSLSTEDNTLRFTELSKHFKDSCAMTSVHLR